MDIIRAGRLLFIVNTKNRKCPALDVIDKNMFNISNTYLIK